MFMLSNRRCVMVQMIGLTAATLLCAQEPYFSRLDKYQTPVPYPGVRGWHLTQNLGPTGMRGWMAGNDPRKADSSESREILVKSVEPGSPADGILRPYDIILGVASAVGQAPERFTADARLAFARAITQAESHAGQGRLPLLRWRDGEVDTVTLALAVMGDYAPTAPFDCPKTARIVKRAAEKVAANMPAEGDSGMIGAINGLFLLATGDERYLEPVRRTASRLSSEPFSPGGHNTWRWGYVNLFLCEYYLATGDEQVLPRIQEYSERMANGQCNPGTWGHKSVEGRIPPGYGSMNQAGLIAFQSLILARQCGVPFDEMALAHAIAFYGNYAGRGGIPYGDHAPDADSACNGKNGSAAVAFNLLDTEPVAQWFAQLCASANLGAFEGGHTGNFFNQLWTPLGAGLSGHENFSRFWSRFNSYRDLARRWDGTFVTQPLPHVREGDLGYGNYISPGPNWSTAAFALGYLGGNKELGILGRKHSVFGKEVPAAMAIQPALAMYRQQRFAECQAAVEALMKVPDPLVKDMAGQLHRAARRNQKSLELVPVGTPPQGEGDPLVRGGYTLQGRMGFVYFSPTPRPSSQASAAGQGAPVPVGLVDTLVADQPQVRRSFGIADPAAVKELLLTWDMDVGGGMRVLLNGTRIMAVSIDPGRWRNARNTLIPLKTTTLELLKPGENELMIELDADRVTTGVTCTLEAVY